MSRRMKKRGICLVLAALMSLNGVSCSIVWKTDVPNSEEGTTEQIFQDIGTEKPPETPSETIFETERVPETEEETTAEPVTEEETTAEPVTEEEGHRIHTRKP